jgi:hypothetical protein
MSSPGKKFSSRFGGHQARSRSIDMTAGTTVIRTRNAPDLVSREHRVGVQGNRRLVSAITTSALANCNGLTRCR